MPSPAVEVVDCFENAFKGGVGVIEDVLALLDDAVVIHEAASMPYPGDFIGHAGFLDLAGRFTATWNFPEEKTFDYLDAGDGRVVVLTNSVVESKATGRRGEWRLSEHFSVRDGRITDIRPFYFDTASLLALIQP